MCKEYTDFARSSRCFLWMPDMHFLVVGSNAVIISRISRQRNYIYVHGNCSLIFFKNMSTVET